MKTVSILILLSFLTLAHSQVITEDVLKSMVKSAQERSTGAHESVIKRTNEEFAKSLWGKKVRFNEADIIKFFSHSAGEKVAADFDVVMNNKRGWGYSYDTQTASNLLFENGVRVANSYNTLWIKAKQDILHAEIKKDGPGITLELYCPQQRFLEVLRIGQTQSIEFLITGYSSSGPSGGKIFGVLSEVHVEQQVITCTNGHSFDKDAGYKFCPTCGEALK
jgi:hypothetical protein